MLPDAAPNANEGKTVAGWTLMYVVRPRAPPWSRSASCLPMMPLLWAGVGRHRPRSDASAVLRALGHGQPRISKDGDVVA